MSITYCGENIIIHVQCIQCGKDFDIMVHEVDYEAWRNGMYVQDAFTYLPANIRELLISQICGICFDNICRDIDD